MNKGAQHLSLSSWYSALIASNRLSNFGNESSSIPSMDFLLNYQDRARMYPLCYSDGQPKETSNPSETNPQDLPASHVMHNFIGSDNAKSAINANSIANPNDGGCDLSLRLGQFSPSSLDAESVWSREFEDVGSSSSGNGSRYPDPSSRGIGAVNFESSIVYSKDKGFYLIPVETSDEPLESCSSKWSSEEEGNVTRQCL